MSAVHFSNGTWGLLPCGRDPYGKGGYLPTSHRSADVTCKACRRVLGMAPLPTPRTTP